MQRRVMINANTPGFQVQNKPHSTPAKQTHAWTGDVNEMARFMPVFGGRRSHLRCDFDNYQGRGFHEQREMALCT